MPEPQNAVRAELNVDARLLVVGVDVAYAAFVETCVRPEADPNVDWKRIQSALKTISDPKNRVAVLAIARGSIASTHIASDAPPLPAPPLFLSTLARSLVNQAVEHRRAGYAALAAARGAAYVDPISAKEIKSMMHATSERLKGLARDMGLFGLVTLSTHEGRLVLEGTDKLRALIADYDSEVQRIVSKSIVPAYGSQGEWTP